MVTDTQVRKLMAELSKDGNLSRAALRADMDRKTARKYRESGVLPSEGKKRRHWRTRANPFEEVWPKVEEMLSAAPELEGQTIFDALCEEHPGRFSPGQLRTLQRHIRRFRAEHGDEREVFFSQEHLPGEAFQTDWTDASELGVTLAGESFPHLICHVVLPYSNWEWGTVCDSESFLSLRSAVRATVIRLGYVPKWHQTDSSSAATHRVKGTRDFNKDYLDLMAYYELKPRTTAIGAKEQNGDVESSHRQLKRRLKQRLILRGSRDFESLEAYERWLFAAFEAFNGRRQKRFEYEISAMRTFTKPPIPVFLEKTVRVNRGSIVTILGRSYSVPSRLIGHLVRARVYDKTVEIYLGETKQLSCERLTGSQYSRIDYRHIIWSLVRKPGAFARYRYREELFPTLAFRQAYDQISQCGNLRFPDLEYLRILHLAASISESAVESSLSHRIKQGLPITFDDIRREVHPPDDISAVDVTRPTVDLTSYDFLCQGVTP